MQVTIKPIGRVKCPSPAGFPAPDPFSVTALVSFVADIEYHLNNWGDNCEPGAGAEEFFFRSGPPGWSLE